MERRIRAVTVISEHRALIFDARAPITIFKSIGRYLLPRGPVTSRDKDARLLAFLRSTLLISTHFGTTCELRYHSTVVFSP